MAPIGLLKSELYQPPTFCRGRERWYATEAGVKTSTGDYWRLVEYHLRCKPPIETKLSAYFSASVSNGRTEVVGEPRRAGETLVVGDPEVDVVEIFDVPKNVAGVIGFQPEVDDGAFEVWSPEAVDDFDVVDVLVDVSGDVGVR